jgi:hypothetical protein
VSRGSRTVCRQRVPHRALSDSAALRCRHTAHRPPSDEGGHQDPGIVGGTPPPHDRRARHREPLRAMRLPSPGRRPAGCALHTDGERMNLRWHRGSGRRLPPTGPTAAGHPAPLMVAGGPPAYRRVPRYGRSLLRPSMPTTSVRWWARGRPCDSACLGSSAGAPSPCNSTSSTAAGKALRTSAGQVVIHAGHA